MSRQLKQQMKQLAEAPSFGAVSPSVLESNRKALLAQIGAASDVRPTYTLRDYADFVTLYVMDAFARPFAVGLSSVALALGGWVVAVNAASGSVPGDTLYPVKIATEQVQLRFTTSPQQRAKLHIEFAGRRLDEVGTVQASERSGKTARVQNALEGFRKELANAQNEIQAVSKNDVSATNEVVAYVGEKTTVYTEQLRARLATESVQESDVTRAEAEAAQTEAVAVGQETVRVLVDRHESSLEQASSDQLKSRFRSDLDDVRAQLSVIHARVETIRDVVGAHEDVLNPELVALTEEMLSRVSERLLQVQPEIDRATNLLAAGGYRATFETMGELKDTMSVVHSLLAQLEVQVSVALANQADTASQSENRLE